MLFVDEIHRMSRPAEEMLYLAMEDFRVDVVIGKGPGATAIPLEIPPFTLVGATTRAGLLPGPLRDRFGFTGHLEFYDAAELDRIVHRSAGLLDVDAAPTTAPPRSRRAPAARRGSPTGCCAGCATTPRSAPTAWSPSTSPRRPWTSTRSTSSASTGSTAPCSTPCAAGSAADRSASRTLAVAVGEERETVEEVAEPFLVRSGFLARTPRGRVATPAAWEHLGLTAPPTPATATPTAVRGVTDRFAGTRRLGRTRTATLARRSARPVPAAAAISTRSSRGLVVQGLVSLLPLVGIALLFWLLIIRPASRRQRELAQHAVAVARGGRGDADLGHLRHRPRHRRRRRLQVEIAAGVIIKVARGAVGHRRESRRRADEPPTTS